MAFKIVGSLMGQYAPVIVKDIYLTDAEGGVEGRLYKLASGRWTKAATTGEALAVCIKAAAGGTNVLGTMELVKTGDILEGTVTGTPDDAFGPGLTVANLDANGSNIDATKVADGHITILSEDTVAGTVRCTVAKCFTAV